jgi:hypothetical protein
MEFSRDFLAFEATSRLSLEIVAGAGREKRDEEG